ncbi:MAG: hypothetical protein ACFHHU_14680 [Porticoccaceae bacterium]
MSSDSGLGLLSLFAIGKLSALSVYEESGGAGPFYILALVSLITLMCGLIPALLRLPATSWLNFHAYFMSWSYVGLVAVGIAQIATMSVNLPAWFTVGLPSIFVVIIGGILIHTGVPKALLAIVSSRSGRIANE